MTAQRFICKRDDLFICGLEYIPQGHNLPIAVISHGYMSDYEATKHYARWFSEHGYAAFCFDFNGGCLFGRSDRDTTKMTVVTEEEDLKAVISYAQGLDNTDPGNITLMGCSMGGFVSAMAASDLTDMIRQLILFYPAFCIPDNARSGNVLDCVINPDDPPETFTCGYATLGKCYLDAVKNMNFEDMIYPYKGRVLIVHGSEDALVDPVYSEKASKVYSNAMLRIIEGAGHGFGSEYDAEALSYVEDFIKGAPDRGI